VSVKEFLKQRAVNIAVGGQYTLPKWLDAQGKPRSFACRTTRVSPFRMIVNVPVVGKVGDRLTTYFGDFGNIDGEISDTLAGGFLLELEMTRLMRQKMSSKLTWLEKRMKDSNVRDGRLQARIVPANAHSTLTFADGSSRGCFVIDMSVSGAAVSADVQPEIGMPLAVGACVGRVVRIFPEGFAIKFLEQVKPDELERRIARAPQISSGGAVKTASRPEDALAWRAYTPQINPNAAPAISPTDPPEPEPVPAPVEDTYTPLVFEIDA
jgi:hypothetical protein